MTAREDLLRAVLDLVDAGAPPPCRAYGDTGEWTSDDRELRTLAAAWCQPCPITAECLAAAHEEGERFGVWGGLDPLHLPSPRPCAYLAALRVSRRVVRGPPAARAGMLLVLRLAPEPHRPGGFTRCAGPGDQRPDTERAPASAAWLP